MSINLDDLKDVVAGTKSEIKELHYYVNKLYPKAINGRNNGIRELLTSLGIVNCRLNTNGVNEYFDTEGNALSHQEVIEILKANAPDANKQ